jgi:hypothetical protein
MKKKLFKQEEDKEELQDKLTKQNREITTL